MVKFQTIPAKITYYPSDKETEFPIWGDERCLINEFFRREQEKPPHLRANSCMISCPCKKCNPGRL